MWQQLATAAMLLYLTSSDGRASSTSSTTSASTVRFTQALGGAASHDQLARLLAVFGRDHTIDANLQIPRSGGEGPIGALAHVAKLHIFLRSAVNFTAAEAKGQDLNVALKLAQALLERGAHTDALDQRDCLSPLHYSAWAGDAALTRLLLAHGARCDADMGAPGVGWTPLHLALEADMRSTAMELALLRSTAERGETTVESAWGIEQVAETSLGGAPLRRLRANAVRRIPKLRSLYVDATNVTRHHRNEYSGALGRALGGPSDGLAVGAALADWSIELVEPLLASGTCTLDAQAGRVSRSIRARAHAARRTAAQRAVCIYSSV